VSRRLLFGTAVILATVLGGCQDGPRTTSKVPKSSVVIPVPAGLQGTWRQDGVGFLAIGPDTVLLNLPGVPRRPARITGVITAGDNAAGLTLDNGWTLSLAGGRAVTTRRLGTQDLAGDCSVVDVTVDGPGTSGAWRLWNEAATTWLPLSGNPSSVVATIAPVALPEKTPGALLLDAVTELRDDQLLKFTRDMLALANSGAERARLEEQMGEILRVQRLAALDLLMQSQGADPTAILRADQLIERMESWQRLTQAWLDKRG
jgi:hypothetical protein